MMSQKAYSFLLYQQFGNVLLNTIDAVKVWLENTDGPRCLFDTVRRGGKRRGKQTAAQAGILKSPDDELAPGSVEQDT